MFSPFPLQNHIKLRREQEKKKNRRKKVLFFFKLPFSTFFFYPQSFGALCFPFEIWWRYFSFVSFLRTEEFLHFSVFAERNLFIFYKVFFLSVFPLEQKGKIVSGLLHFFAAAECEFRFFGGVTRGRREWAYVCVTGWIYSSIEDLPPCSYIFHRLEHYLIILQGHTQIVKIYCYACCCFSISFSRKNKIV